MDEVAPDIVDGLAFGGEDADRTADVFVVAVRAVGIVALIVIKRAKAGVIDLVEGTPNVVAGRGGEVGHATLPLFVGQGEGEAMIVEAGGAEEAVDGAESLHLGGAEVGAVGEVADRCGRGARLGVARRHGENIGKGMTGEKRPAFWMAGLILVVLVATYAWWHGRGVEVAGRVALRNWDGALTVPPGARVAVLPAAKVERRVRQRLAALDRVRAEAVAEQDKARARWQRKAASRDAAQRVVRVAERANAPDLELCRRRLAVAEAELAEAFADLEALAGRVERLSDPRALVAGLVGPGQAAALDEEGRFAVRAPAGARPVVLVEAEPGLVWLEPVERRRGKPVVLDFSNANVLDLATLRSRMGRPAQ